MPTAIAYRGRLPGVRCDPAQPLAADETIRLDVAAFVGFAERGPVDDPQVVEDPEQYAAIFGGDLQLAFDDHGVPVYAALPDAVRSYFDNGGRRAYVVRVTSPAVAAGPPEPVPVRLPVRRPLGAGAAVVSLTTALDAPLELRAAFPGVLASRIRVDATVVDTVLGLATDADGITDLTRASRRQLDDGDAVLVRRGPDDAVTWELLWATAWPTPLAPAGGWQAGDVARLLRAELTVGLFDAAATGEATIVEHFADLRLGPSVGTTVRSRCWSDVLQPAIAAGGGFRRERSMYVRAPDGASTLTPVVGKLADHAVSVVDVPATPPAASRAALGADGLDVFDPASLFLDPRLSGHTVEGLRLELELLGLEDEPLLRGVHALALEPEVSIVAVPDLYHRPWSEQAVLVDHPDAAPEPEPATPEPVGFGPCTAAAPPPPPPVADPPPPAVLRMVTDPATAYDPVGLDAVAAATADLCAARADMVAVLGLPRHGGFAEAGRLADVLGRRPSATADVASYVGLWHPWGAVAERRSADLAPLRPVPPDGAVAGSIAGTELTRGWWVEPAGRPLAGFLAADAFEPATTLALFDRGLNVVRRRPSGFVTTSAHTVSADRDLLQLSVRRLLIYVRKLALREGSRLAFEPDDERFRDRIAATFVRFLERLRVAGALAAYDVVVERLADRPAADEGKVRIDLALAPTSPIEFVTVTLLRSGDGLVQVAGV